MFGEAAPVIDAADQHERQGESCEAEQLLRRHGVPCDQAPENDPCGNNQKPPHRWGSRLALMGFGAFLTDELPHLQAT